ncbi:hypothetical protein [Desulfovibrio inopinatus]|uniref:hypothetical protein n=1 Tax=Desulfovibrio inopinatus TaxID=102109 RepID=UPI000481C0C7|nr:hypothetical protein [Desulfovibrio inopinatus]
MKQENKPWAILKMNRKRNSTIKPWKTFKMSREKFEAMLLNDPEEWTEITDTLYMELILFKGILKKSMIPM